MLRYEGTVHCDYICYHGACFGVQTFYPAFSDSLEVNKGDTLVSGVNGVCECEL